MESTMTQQSENLVHTFIESKRDDLTCFGRLPALPEKYILSHERIEKISHTIASQAIFDGHECYAYAIFHGDKFAWVEGKGLSNVPLDIANLFLRKVPNVQSLIGVTKCGTFLFTPINGISLENYLIKLAAEGKHLPKNFFTNLLAILVNFCKIQGRCYGGLALNTIFVSDDGEITLAFPPRMTFDNTLQGEYTECQAQFSEFWSPEQKCGEYPLPTDDLFSFCAIILYVLGHMRPLPKRRPLQEFSFQPETLDPYIATISGNEKILEIVRSVLLRDYKGKGILDELIEHPRYGRKSSMVFQLCEGILKDYQEILAKIEGEITVQLPQPRVPSVVKKQVASGCPNLGIDFGKITNYYAYFGSLSHVGLENGNTVLRVIFKKKANAIEASKMVPPFASLFKEIKIRYN